VTGSDLLQTLAEVGISLAGFTGIVAVLGRRSDGEWAPHEWLRLAMMLNFSFGSVFFAFLPLLFVAVGAREPGAWAASSALLAAFLLVSYGIIVRRVLQLGDVARSEFPRWAGVTVGAGTLVVFGLQTSNALGPSGFGLYFVGMLWLVAAAALQFYRLLRH
jgi:hypothetical protein